MHFNHANSYTEHWHPREYGLIWNLTFWHLWNYLTEKKCPNSTHKMKTKLGEVIDSFNKENVSSPIYQFIWSLLIICIYFKRQSLTLWCWTWGHPMASTPQLPVPPHTLLAFLILNLKSLPHQMLGSSVKWLKKLLILSASAHGLSPVMELSVFFLLINYGVLGHSFSSIKGTVVLMA